MKSLKPRNSHFALTNKFLGQQTNVNMWLGKQNKYSYLTDLKQKLELKDIPCSWVEKINIFK